MIDVYTIGITLALEDGVSEGISAIRRELAALDNAIAASAAQLLMLRNLAAELPLPVQGRQMVQRASLSARLTPDKQAAQPPVATSDAAATVSSAAPSSSPASSPPIIATPPGTEALSPPHRAGAPALSLPPPAIERPAMPALPLQPPQAPVAPPAAPPGSAAPKDAPPTMGEHLPAAPIAAPAPAAPMRPPNGVQPTPRAELRNGGTAATDFAAFARALAPTASAPTTGTPQQSERLTASPASPAGRSPTIMAVPPPEPLPRDIPQAQYASSPPTLAPIQLPARSDAPVPVSAPRKSAAPLVSVQIPQATSSVAAREPNPSAPESDLAGTQQTDRPASAEMYLDGAALGRWVTRHLERQVTRPQAGATGFDPRITPSWSGAPIGN